jgi:aldose 1-epimerase
MGSSFSRPQSQFGFLPLGAIIQQFNVEGRNIILNFPSQDDYINQTDLHFGGTIGRVANRLKNAIVQLNGHEYQLDKNDRKIAFMEDARDGDNACSMAQ